MCLLRYTITILSTTDAQIYTLFVFNPFDVAHYCFGEPLSASLVTGLGILYTLLTK